VCFQIAVDTISQGDEIFAYVVNLCKNGDQYWVLAHVTPTFDDNGVITGYHSSRRKPEQEAIDKVVPVYELLLNEENSHSDWRAGMKSETEMLVAHLNGAGVQYDEFVFSL
jgi:hypothetical protein